jgi:hypothetical protein
MDVMAKQRPSYNGSSENFACAFPVFAHLISTDRLLRADLGYSIK